MQHREERLNSLILRELAIIIAKEIETSGTLITLTNAAISRDLATVKIGVSVLPSEKGPEALKTLLRQAGYFQHLLIKKMRIRRVPDIQFELDHGPEKAARLEKVMTDEETRQ